MTCTPWTELPETARAEFIARVRDFLLPARRHEQRFYASRGYTDERYAAVACSDGEHARYAHDYGRLVGMSHEDMLARPWRAVDAMLTYMS